MTKSITLQEKRAAITREHLLEEAYQLLVNHPDQPFSHEAIAARAGVGARTVYRYFPAQSDLYEELWTRVRTQAETTFPTSEEQILPQIPILFRAFDRNSKVVNAVLQSPAGHRVRERGAAEGRAAFQKSLKRLTAGLDSKERRRVVAVFQAMYSAPFWELLRQRGRLSEADAVAAAEWAMSVLMKELEKKSQTTTSE